MTGEPRKLHFCDPYVPWNTTGPAITVCYENEDGTLWVSNGEYSSQISFCPFCGFASQTKATHEH